MAFLSWPHQFTEIIGHNPHFSPFPQRILKISANFQFFKNLTRILVLIKILVYNNYSMNPTSQIKLEREDTRIKLTLPYNPTYIKKIKTIPGYRWHPDKKYWSFPYSEDILKRILSIFKGENIQVDSTLQVSFNQKSYKQTPTQIQITEAVKKELKLRGYSQNTRKVYLHHIERYIGYFAKDPKELDEKHIRDYMLYLIDKKKCRGHIMIRQ